jgi:Domain of unknown function (DUF4381)
MTGLARMMALAVLAASGAADSAVRVTATPSKSEVALGETFSLDVKATGPAGTVWIFPDQAGNDDVDVRTPAAAPRTSAPSEDSGTHRYEAAAVALTDVAVPPIEVHYRLPDGTEGEASTEAVPLKVLSVLPKDPGEQTLADIRGPLSVPIAIVFWVAVAICAALLAALTAWLLKRRRRKPTSAPPVAEQTPDAEARAALDRLAASDYLTRGDHRAYYIALTDVAKRYLERRLGAPVLEMTSSEMVTFLRDREEGRGLWSAARELSAAADQVKFAQGAAVFEEARRHMAAVRQMIDALEEKLGPSAAGAPGERVA